MGLGRFGGGVGVTRFLVEQGADVLVTDMAEADALGRSLAMLDDLDVTFRLGGHDPSILKGADLLVVNPAVDRHGHAFLAEAEARGIATTSEIRLLVERLPQRRRVIGVTGSAGKSTVTAMIGHLLGRQETVHVGGNLGGSLLTDLRRIGQGDWVVLELSSFMLEDLDVVRWSPHVAVVTNVTPNHLDRHGTFVSYVAAKQVILDHQHDGDLAVLGPTVREHLRPRAATAHEIGDAPPPVELRLPGRHNQLNARLAIAAVHEAAGIGVARAAADLADFAGLPHRLQCFCEHEDVRFFNDSKSTTPEAAILAIESFPPRTVHVLLGGYDKQSDLTALGRLAAERCAGVYAIGATGESVARAAASGPASVSVCETVERAVEKAVTRIRRGDVVLLSPGCASWDQFENYEARGSAFCEAVLRCTGEGA